MNRTRWAVAALTIGLCLGLGGGVVPTARVEAATVDAGLAEFYRQRLTWHDCQQGPQDAGGQALDAAGARCAEVSVPLDYRRPAGRRISVAISRLPATDTAGRIGALVLNLGGPAIPGLDTPPLARQAMGETGARFDLIGMDRRFVGRSAPLDCGWSSSWIPRSAGVDRASFDRMVALSRELAGRCGRHRDVLAHATTANTARDLDVVRAALAERTLSYLGYSQGTYLGALYMQLFPGRTERMVLDSGIDPARAGVRVLRDSGPVREAALRDWAGWAADRDAEFHLGTTAEAVLGTVGRVYQAAARKPLRIGPFHVDDTVLPGVLLGPLADDSAESSAELAAIVGILARATDTGAAEPTESLTHSLSRVLTGAESAQLSQTTAIVCADAPTVSRDPEWYWRDIQAHRADEPLFGPMARTITPCAFWPATPKGRAVRVANHVPALIVHASGDIDANAEYSQALHRALAGSRMITLDGVRTHGVYLFKGAACVDDAVNAYLVTGALPPADQLCDNPPQ